MIFGLQGSRAPRSPPPQRWLRRAPAPFPPAPPACHRAAAAAARARLPSSRSPPPPPPAVPPWPLAAAAAAGCRRRTHRWGIPSGPAAAGPRRGDCQPLRCPAATKAERRLPAASDARLPWLRLTRPAAAAAAASDSHLEPSGESSVVVTVVS